MPSVDCTWQNYPHYLLIEVQIRPQLIVCSAQPVADIYKQDICCNTIHIGFTVLSGLFPSPANLGVQLYLLAVLCSPLVVCILNCLSIIQVEHIYSTDKKTYHYHNRLEMMQLLRHYLRRNFCYYALQSKFGLTLEIWSIITKKDVCDSYW